MAYNEEYDAMETSDGYDEPFTSDCNVAYDIGFAQYPSIPAAIHRSLSPGNTAAVIAMIRDATLGPASRICLVASYPSNIYYYNTLIISSLVHHHYTCAVDERM